MTSIRTSIQSNLVSRLETIKTSNGYDIDVQKVIADDIPMGLSLEDYEVPAIIVIAGEDVVRPSHGCIKNEAIFELQLVHGDVPDSTMNDFVRAIGKAIYANSPVANIVSAWRGPYPNGIHESLFKVDIIRIEPDLNMIEANRIYSLFLSMHYSTTYNEM